MNCNEAREMIHPYVDDELELVKTLEIENHIRECNQCAATHRSIVALRFSFHDGTLYYRAPAGLERRIRSDVRQKTITHVMWLRNWAAAAAAIALIATLSWFASRGVGG